MENSLHQVLRYYAPYLSMESEDFMEIHECAIQYDSPVLYDVISPKAKPKRRIEKGAICEMESACVPEEDEAPVNLKSKLFTGFAISVKASLSSKSEEDDSDLTLIPQPEIQDQETLQLLRNLQDNIEQLRKRGVPMSVLQQLLDQQEHLSPLVITEDYRILLPDYQLEVQMTALPKTLYLFFLIHSEGVVLKELQDHYKELCNIYRQIKPNVREEKLHTTITKLVNPLMNRANEVISLIRASFVSTFDEHLAQHYVVNGEKGQLYRIPLDKNLITWLED